MALTQVRANIAGQWVTLTYNPDNGHYEGTAAPASISNDQPGGYFNVQVEAANDTGKTATADGTGFSGLRLVVQDTAPPTVSITSPANGAMTAGASVTVTGTASDTGSGIASVTVNGVAAEITDGAFSATIILTEGENTITAVAADAAGNTASASVSVVLDTTPPALSITTPSAGMMTNQPAMTVTGTVTDAGSGVASVTVNGQTATITGDAYTFPVTLTEGVNTFTVVATDNVGNQSTQTQSVLLDTAHPVLTLVSPENYYQGVNTPEVVFHAEDETGGSGVDWDSAAIAVDGAAQTAGLTVSGSELHFTPPAPLPDGVHTFTASIRDNAGNLWSLAATYLVDTVPPSLELIALGRHRVVDWETFPVRGAAADDGSGVAAVTVDGAAAELDANGRFSVSAPLEIGENTVEVKTVDRAGHETVLTFWVIRLITDRTRADLDRIRTFLQTKTWDQCTQAEKDYFLGVVKGSYKASDRNRVGVATGYVAGWLTAAGYLAEVTPKTDWTDADAPTVTPMETYLHDIEQVRQSFKISLPPTPKTMKKLGYQSANDIETILVATDAIRPLLEVSPMYFGEVMAGEV